MVRFSAEMARSSCPGGDARPPILYSPHADLADIAYCKVMTTTQQSATRSKTSELAPRLRLNLSRNLAALQKHRPDTLEAIAAVEGNSGRYSMQLVAGKHALFRCGNDGTWSCLSPIQNGRLVADPVAPYRQALSSLTGKALCGIGDGAILDWLARHEPTDAESRATGAGTVYLIEPDAELVLFNLMLRDFSAAIEQQRFYWFIGPNWQEAAAKALIEQPMLVNGGCVIGQGSNAAELTALWKSLSIQRNEAFEADCIAAAEYAGKIDRAELAACFTGKAGRQPRVLLITSHHTTVLQYSTRDAAAAFEELGWQTHLLIEQQAHHVVGQTAVMRAIARFKPDLIFTIDHLRSEVPRVPAEIPFVCWVQDNLPNLTNDEAASSIGLRDFIIGGWLNRYVRLHKYPARQCIATRRMTRKSCTSHPPQARVEDMVYVSNQSDQPHERLDRLIRERPLPNVPEAERLIRHAGARLIDAYANGTGLGGLQERCSLAQQAAAQYSISLNDEEAERIARFLEDLHFMLHRQQAVLWAATIAQRHGLSLGLYGNGWERHPKFTEHARGVIAYGDDLEALTQQARINLQLEPFMPTQHQRLLDGLIAGGFFLCRIRHPLERLHRRMLSFIDRIDPARMADNDVETSRDASLVKELHAIRTDLTAAKPQLDDVDALAWMRRPQMQGLYASMRIAPLPPRYFDVAFHDASEFEGKVLKYLHDDAARMEIVAEQKRFVEDHFTYQANLRDVMQRIGALIADEA